VALDGVVTLAASLFGPAPDGVVLAAGGAAGAGGVEGADAAAGAAGGGVLRVVLEVVLGVVVDVVVDVALEETWGANPGPEASARSKRG
jgi:hypothetical protein